MESVGSLTKITLSNRFTMSPGIKSLKKSTRSTCKEATIIQQLIRSKILRDHLNKPLNTKTLRMPQITMDFLITKLATIITMFRALEMNKAF